MTIIDQNNMFFSQALSKSLPLLMQYMAKYRLSPSSTLRSGTFHNSKHINAKRLVRDYINAIARSWDW